MWLLAVCSANSRQLIVQLDVTLSERFKVTLLECMDVGHLLWVVKDDYGLSVSIFLNVPHRRRYTTRFFPFQSVNYNCTLAKKKLNGSGEYPFMGLQHYVPLELTGEILFDYWTQPDQHLFYFSTSTLLSFPLNRHSLGSFNFFYQRVWYTSVA